MSPLRLLIPYLRPHRMRVLATVLLATVTAFCAFGSVGSVKPLFDTLFAEDGNTDLVVTLRSWGAVGAWIAGTVEDVLTGDRMRALVAVMVWFVGLTLLGGVTRFLQQYLGGTLSQRVMLDVSCDLQSKTIRQSPGFLGGFGVGNAISRFTSDIESLGSGIRSFFDVLLPEPMKFLLALALALAVSWKLTILVVVLFPISFFLIRFLGRVVKRAGKRVLEKRALILRLLQDTLFGLPVVQVYGREADAADRFRRTADRVYAYWRKVIRTESATGPAVEMIGVLGGSAALVVAGHMVLSEELSPGSFGLFFVAIFSLYEPIRKLARTINRLQIASAGATRIFELMDHRPDIRDRDDATSLPPLSGSILLEQVAYAYPGREAALRGISLEIPAGATVAVVGPSGAGKSTFANLIPRLIDPDEGRVRIDGHDLRDVSLASLRGQIALVPQETILFNDTIESNIAFARPDATREEIRSAATAAHVAEFAERLEDGYATLVGEGGRGLSGGQRQRLALARAMLRDPRIVILDEATSALDPDSVALIRESLDTFLEGRTAIVIAHHPATIRRADLVVVMSDGRIEFSGDPETCRRESEVFRSFVAHDAALGGAEAS